MHVQIHAVLDQETAIVDGLHDKAFEQGLACETIAAIHPAKILSPESCQHCAGQLSTKLRLYLCARKLALRCHAGCHWLLATQTDVGPGIASL